MGEKIKHTTLYWLDWYANYILPQLMFKFGGVNSLLASLFWCLYFGIRIKEEFSLGIFVGTIVAAIHVVCAFEMTRLEYIYDSILNKLNMFTLVFLAMVCTVASSFFK